MTVGPAAQSEPVVFNRRIDEASEVRLTGAGWRPRPGDAHRRQPSRRSPYGPWKPRCACCSFPEGPPGSTSTSAGCCERDATVESELLAASRPTRTPCAKARRSSITSRARSRSCSNTIASSCLTRSRATSIRPGPAHVEQLGGQLRRRAAVRGRARSTRRASPTRPAPRPLLDLLPVVIDANESDLMLNEMGHFQTTAWPLVVPPAAMSSPVLAMSDRAGRKSADLEPAAGRVLALPRARGRSRWRPCCCGTPTRGCELVRRARAAGHAVLRLRANRLPGVRRHLALAALRRSLLQPLLDAAAAPPGRGQAAQRPEARADPGGAGPVLGGRAGDGRGPAAGHAAHGR